MSTNIEYGLPYEEREVVVRARTYEGAFADTESWVMVQVGGDATILRGLTSTLNTVLLAMRDAFDASRSGDVGEITFNAKQPAWKDNTE